MGDAGCGMRKYGAHVGSSPVLNPLPASRFPLPAPPIPLQMTHLATIDYLLMIVYFAVVLVVGWMLRRSTQTSTDFFLSGRSIPSWVAGLAFISANLGAQEVIGMG